MAKPFIRRFSKKFFIICNVIVAVLFLLGAYAKFFNPLKWWFLGLLTLSLPYILILLLLFILFWGIAKKVWVVISLLTILLCWGPVRNILPLNFSSSFKIEKNTESIRVMSWNVEHFDILEYKTHPEVKQKMIELIEKYQPDIACFQEMVGGDDDRAINYLGDFKDRLKFSGYYYSYENRFNFDRVHHFGIITFSKFPIINKQTISIPPNDYNSTFQYTDMIINNDTVRVFNIHLQSLKFTQNNLDYLDNPSMNTDTAITESKTIISKLKRGFLRRALQANRIKEELDKSIYPKIVCGDFNDVPNSYAYSTIGDGLQNAFVAKGDGIGRTFTRISPTLRIDNIFADKIFTVNQFTRIKQKLSDHFPIIADITLHVHN